MNEGRQDTEKQHRDWVQQHNRQFDKTLQHNRERWGIFALSISQMWYEMNVSSSTSVSVWPHYTSHVVDRTHPVIWSVSHSTKCVLVVYHVPVLQSTTSAPLILSAYPLGLCLHLSVPLSVHLSSGHRLHCLYLQTPEPPLWWYHCPSHTYTLMHLCMGMHTHKNSHTHTPEILLRNLVMGFQSSELNFYTLRLNIRTMTKLSCPLSLALRISRFFFFIENDYKQKEIQ